MFHFFTSPPTMDKQTDNTRHESNYPNKSHMCLANNPYLAFAFIIYISVSCLQDGNGISLAVIRVIKFEIEGPGEIVATDNGDATNFVPFPSHEREAFNGLALVIVKSKTKDSGLIKIIAKSAGLVKDEIIVQSQ